MKLFSRKKNGLNEKQLKRLFFLMDRSWFKLQFEAWACCKINSLWHGETVIHKNFKFLQECGYDLNELFINNNTHLRSVFVWIFRTEDILLISDVIKTFGFTLETLLSLKLNLSELEGDNEVLSEIYDTIERETIGETTQMLFID